MAKKNRGKDSRDGAAAPTAVAGEQKSDKIRSDHPAFAPHPHRTDELPDKVPDRIHYFRAVVDAAPLSETPMAELINHLASLHPTEATRLRHEYAHKLLPKVRAYQAAVDEENTRVADANAAAARHNEAVETAVTSIKAERATALAPHEEELAKRRDKLNDAREKARVACAAAGGAFDPANPTENCVLPTEPMSESEAAAELGVPNPAGLSDRSMPALAWLASTLIVGGFMGIAVGCAAGFVDIEALWKHPLTDFILWCAGTALAWVAKGANRKYFRTAGVYRYSPDGQKEFPKALAVAFAVFAVTLAASMSADCAGLLQFVAQDQGWSMGGPESAQPSIHAGFIMIACLSSFAFLACAAHEGYADGTREEIGGRVDAKRKSALAVEIANQRGQVKVQAALAQVSGVRKAEHEIAEQIEIIRNVSAPFDAEIERLRASIRDDSQELSAEARQRVRDAYEAAIGAQADFDADLDAAMSFAKIAS